METPPPLVTESQRRKDDEHIKLLSIFHFVVSGLALLGIAFLFLHYFMMTSIFSHPERWKGEDGAALLVEFFHVFVWIYLFTGVMLVTGCVVNFLSGVFLRKRKHRMFSLVVAGLDCLQIPFGTALGVLTIIVLLRDSVRQAYAANEWATRHGGPAEAV